MVELGVAEAATTETVNCVVRTLVSSVPSWVVRVKEYDWRAVSAVVGTEMYGLALLTAVLFSAWSIVQLKVITVVADTGHSECSSSALRSMLLPTLTTDCPRMVAVASARPDL
jgi:hypothetical protein